MFPDYLSVRHKGKNRESGSLFYLPSGTIKIKHKDIELPP